MNLTQKVTDLIKTLPENKENAKQYLMDIHLDSYFKDTNEEQRKRYTNLLEQNIDRSFEKYRKDLESSITKIGCAAGIGIGLNEILGVSLSVPASYISGTTYAFILGKIALELPKVYNYLKNTKDLNGLYGLTMYGLRKSAGLAIPIAGPMIEGNSLKDMLLKRIIYESKKGFLKDIGKYESVYERVKSRVQKIAGEITIPVKKPGYQPV